MPSKLLHFDTYYSTYLDDPTNTATTRPNAYECQFVLPAPVRKVRRVALKSAEMPITFGQTRGAVVQSSCAGYFAVIVAGTRYDFVMTSRTYSSITEFIVDFNESWTAYVGTPSGKGGTLSVITEAGATASQFFLLFTFPTSTTVEFIDGPLSTAIMGFKSSVDSGTGLQLGASQRFNLNPDNYLSMYIKEIPNPNMNVSCKPMTFKIPLSVTYSNVLYYSDQSNGFKQTIDVPPSLGYNMDRLTVYIYDRWGYQLAPYGGDYTFTLQVDYDD
jgi:hypothetical protein